MEAKIVKLRNMGSLCRLLKANFPQIDDINVFEEAYSLNIRINKEINPVSPLIKLIHEFLKIYIADHGDPKESYDFTVYRGKELQNSLRYNDPGSEIYITIEMDGKIEKLRILDVMGATGDYTVYNENFECLGYVYCDGPTEFSAGAIWGTHAEKLKPYLDEIVTKMGKYLEDNAVSLEVDLYDPEDVSFWAEQFELSESDLRKAVLAAGKSIDNITAYLQK